MNSARIRWERRGSLKDWTGYIGGEMLFHIFTAGRDRATWAMVNSLPGMSDQIARGIVADDPNADKLKAEAERWLEEFVVSLGAIFPDALREVIKMERDAQDGRAAEHAEYGRDARSEQCYAEVKTLDWMLATLDRIAHRSPSRPTRKRKADR